MTYEVIGAAAKATDFQNRCWGAVIEMSRDIIAAVQDSGTIMDDASPQNDLTQESCKNQAKKFGKVTNLSTRETIANLMLMNSAVAADPMGCTEGTIQYQCKQIWMTLVEYG